MFVTTAKTAEKIPNGPAPLKTCFLAYAASVGSDQPVQSNQGLHCPLTESLGTSEYKNGEQRSG